MKTTAMAHQLVGLSRMENKNYFGLAPEQGTGKTWMALADAEGLFLNKQIGALLVAAPNGVHTNWIRREVPIHLEVPVQAAYWKAGAGKKERDGWARLCRNKDPSVLKVFAMNIDAFNTKAGMEFARMFLDCNRETEFVLDESSRIKNMYAKRTKNLIDLAPMAPVRRILSGTMVTTGPINLFPQFEFMAPHRALLGTRSYRAFVAEYAELLPKDNPVFQKAKERQKRGGDPQIIVRNPDGTKRWKNLDKLRRMVAPHIYRVLKKDCLDLPEKVFKPVYFELSAAQRKSYDLMEKRLRWERDNGIVDRFTALTKTTKLRQLVSGFIFLDEQVHSVLPLKDNPKIQVLKEVLEDVEGSFIIWCSFKEEISQLKQVLQEMEISFVEYHGEISKADREISIDIFQSKQATCFLATADAGGIGITLTAAATAIYYSRDYSLEKRLQSIDRNHRIGSEGQVLVEGESPSVLYVDICAVNTIDERVTASLLANEEVSDRILNYL